MSDFKEGMPITLSFKKDIRSDGSLTVVRIIQGTNEIQLTLMQAKVVVDQLRARIEEKR